MSTLQKMFPSLTLFSDLDWDAVTKEYETDYIDISFPEYLQQKAVDGDCPPYLFEIAYYELALFDAKTSDTPFPHQSGVYLNPSALFLSLEYDVIKMLAEAKKGLVEVMEREHVLCLFRDKSDKVRSVELDDEALKILQHLEDGPQKNRQFLNKDQKSRYEEMVRNGLIFELV